MSVLCVWSASAERVKAIQCLFHLMAARDDENGASACMGSQSLRGSKGTARSTSR